MSINYEIELFDKQKKDHETFHKSQTPHIMLYNEDMLFDMIETEGRCKIYDYSKNPQLGEKSREPVDYKDFIMHYLLKDNSIIDAWDEFHIGSGTLCKLALSANKHDHEAIEEFIESLTEDHDECTWYLNGKEIT